MAALVYDPSTERLLLFGGSDGSAMTSSLYRITDNGVEEVLPMSGADWPSPRKGHSMVYDWQRADHRVVLLGGEGDGTGTCATYCNDLWGYDDVSANWEMLLPAGDAANFTHRTGQTVAYVPNMGQALLFGGEDSDGPHNDLYRFRTHQNLVPQLRVRHYFLRHDTVTEYERLQVRMVAGGSGYNSSLQQIDGYEGGLDDGSGYDAWPMGGLGTAVTLYDQRASYAGDSEVTTKLLGDENKKYMHIRLRPLNQQGHGTSQPILTVDYVESRLDYRITECVAGTSYCDGSDAITCHASGETATHTTCTPSSCSVDENTGLAACDPVSGSDGGVVDGGPDGGALDAGQDGGL